MKKGYTLVELLTVIIILSVLALITVPVVTNIINDSKLSSAERSLEGYVKAIENAQIDYAIVNGKRAKTLEELSIEAKAKQNVTVEKYEFDKDRVLLKIQAKVDGFNCIYKSGNNAKCQKEQFADGIY